MKAALPEPAYPVRGEKNRTASGTNQRPYLYREIQLLTDKPAPSSISSSRPRSENLCLVSSQELEQQRK